MNPAAPSNPRHPALWPALGILLLIIVNTIFDLAAGRTPFAAGSFLHLSFAAGAPAGALIDILIYGAPIAILALGMAPVIATRGVDLSVGSVMAVSGAVAGTLAASHTHPALCIGAALGAALLCGLWNGLLVTAAGLQPFVATLILMVAGRGLAQMITGSQVSTFDSPAVSYLASGRILYAPFPFLLALALLGLSLLATRRTALGLLLEAVGGNPEAARLAGVRSGTIIGASYIACSLCAGLAGLIVAGSINAADPFHAGRAMELAAIFAVVVGGTPLTGGRFSLFGAFVGALLLRTLTTTMYARNINDDIAPLPQALVILAVCAASSPRVRAMLTRRRR